MNRSLSQILFFFLIAGTWPTYSQTPFWTETGPFQGEAVTTLFADSLGRLYAGTYHGIYTSTNNGTQWVYRGDGSCNYTIQDFAMHPNGAIYAVGETCGLMRTTDGGVTWSYVSGHFQSHCVAINSMGHIFVGAEQDWNLGRLYRSTDGGSTWSWTDLPRWAVAFSLLVDPNDYVYAGTAGQGIFLSTNHGASWDSINSGLTGRSVSDLVIGRNGMIFAGIYPKGVLRSTNNGSTWQQTSLDSGNVRSLARDEYGRIFAAVWPEGILVTDDDGATWVPTNNGLTNTRTTAIATKPSGLVFAGTYGTGVFATTNSGASWLPAHAGMVHKDVNAITLAQDGGLLAGLSWGGGVQRSTNQGQEWLPSGLQGNDISSLATSTNGSIFATSGGLYRSTDSGANWTKLDFSGWGEYVRNAFNSQGHVFVGTTDSGVYRSTNNGNNWTKVNSGLTNIRVLDIAIKSNDYVFVGTAGGGVFRSTDNGDSWTAMNSGLPWLWIFALGINQNGHLFAGETKIYCSTNDGELWTEAYQSGSYFSVTDFAFNSAGHVFAAANFLGVLRSTNNGSTWDQVNSGLASTYVSGLTVNADGFLYAATGGAGVRRSTQSTTSAWDFPDEAPSEFRLEQNYPNPFNSSSKIRFFVPITSHVTVSVVNPLGQEKATLTSGILEAGWHESTLDASEWPSGVYFYSLVLGEKRLTRKALLLK